MSKVQSIALDAFEGHEPDMSREAIILARKKRKKKKSEKKTLTDKYTRGEKNSTKGITSHKLKQTLKTSEKFAQKSVEEASKAEILLPSEAGYLEADEGVEETWRIAQDELKDHIDVRSQRKMMDLDLTEFGPYKMDFTRNGRHLLMGGRKGHIAIMDWQNFKLKTELHVRETIRDVKFLHDETMFAVAQKKYLYIYDNTGTELHCMKNHFDLNALEFLPYHFLLASVGKTGYLKYLDTSTGQNVSEHRTKLGECKVMRQNPNNAILCLGHNKGTVTMWSPNMNTPLVKMLCHRAAVLDLAVDPGGYDLVTSGMDGQVKVWDIRTYKEKHSYFTARPATTIDVSARGLMALGFGSTVQVWKDALATKQKSPYMRQQLKSGVERLRFCPFEDILGSTHEKGFSSMVIPGAGEPNFDTFEANPFQTKKQRREKTVVSLLEKLQADMITLDPNMFGLMDRNSKIALQGDRRAMKDEKAQEELSEANKQRGRNRSSKRWKRKRKNIVDHEFEQRKEKIVVLQKLRSKDKKDAQRKKEGKAKDTLDRFDR